MPDHDAIRRVERAAVAEEAVAALRHDVRNKLASVRNAAFYLRRKSEIAGLLATDPRATVFFGLIDDELVAIERLLAGQPPVGHLLGVGIAPTHLGDVVQRALAMAAPPVGIAVEPSFEEIPPVVGSALELTLVVLSILDNALEAMGGTGTLVVRTYLLGAAPTLEITDSGGGMDPGTQARAFQAYESRKPGHLGVGLGVARRLAARCSGRLELEVSPRGTTVRLSFPAAAHSPGDGDGAGP